MLKVAEELKDGLIIFTCWEEHGGGTVGYLADYIYKKWKVRQALPSTLFRVKMENSQKENGNEEEILAYLSGKMRMNRIKVLVGDLVVIVIDPFCGKGRIVKRF